MLGHFPELLRGEGILKKGRSNKEGKLIYRSASLTTKLRFITISKYKSNSSEGKVYYRKEGSIKKQV